MVIYWINNLHYCTAWNAGFEKEVNWMGEWLQPFLIA